MSNGGKAFLGMFIMWMIPTIAYAVYTNDWGIGSCRSITDTESYAILFWGTVFSLFMAITFAIDESKK